jgi:hypothetical protein
MSSPQLVERHRLIMEAIERISHNGKANPPGSGTVLAEYLRAHAGNNPAETVANVKCCLTNLSCTIQEFRNELRSLLS